MLTLTGCDHPVPGSCGQVKKDPHCGELPGHSFIIKWNVYNSSGTKTLFTVRNKADGSLIIGAPKTKLDMPGVELKYPPPDSPNLTPLITAGTRTGSPPLITFSCTYTTHSGSALGDYLDGACKITTSNQKSTIGNGYTFGLDIEPPS
jgi:hypothetical protein